MLAQQELFEKLGGNETCKPGHIVEIIPCWANDVGQYCIGRP